MSYDFKHASNQDMFNTVANRAMKGYLVGDQRRYDNEVAQRDQRFHQESIQLTGDLQQRNQAESDRRATDDTTTRENARADREKNADAFSLILKAITAGAELTPALQEQAHAFSGLPPESTNVILDAATRGAAALTKAQKDEAAQKQTDEMAQIGARSAGGLAEARVRAADSPKEAKATDPHARRVKIDKYLTDWNEINPQKRPADAPPPGTPADVMERVAALKVDQGLSTTEALKQDNTEETALGLAPALGIDADQIDEPALDSSLLSEIAKSMGIVIQAKGRAMSLLELASTGSDSATLKALIGAYKNHGIGGAVKNRGVQDERRP